jgi:hypothetical protein
VIKPASALPPINGPVQIEGAAWKRTGDFIAVDGSGYIEDKGTQTCPGAVPGQYGANVRTTTNPGLATEGGQHKIVAMRSILKKNKHRWKGELAPLNPFCEAISFG